MSNPACLIPIDQSKYLAESISHHPCLELTLSNLDTGACLAVYAPATHELLSEVESIVKENYNMNEARLCHKEGHYCAEMVCLQGAMALDLKTHQ